MSPRTSSAPAAVAPVRRAAASAPAAASRPAAAPARAAAAPAAARPVARAAAPAAAPARASAPAARPAAAPAGRPAQPSAARPAVAPAARTVTPPASQPAAARPRTGAAPAPAPAAASATRAPAPRRAAPAPLPEPEEVDPAGFDENPDQGFGDFPDAGEFGAGGDFGDFADPAAEAAEETFGGDDQDGAGSQDPAFDPDQDGGDGQEQDVGDGFGDGFGEEPAEVEEAPVDNTPKLKAGEYALAKGVKYYEFSQGSDGAWKAGKLGAELARKVKVIYQDDYAAQPIVNKQNKPGQTWVLVAKGSEFIVLVAETLTNIDGSPVTLKAPKARAAAPAAAAHHDEVAESFDADPVDADPAVGVDEHSEEQTQALQQLADAVNAMRLAFPAFDQLLAGG